jgi:hypothetical protein
MTPWSSPVAGYICRIARPVGNQFAAKPLGAWLFAVAAAAPSGLDALTFAVAAALVAAVRGTGGETVSAERSSTREDLIDGLR